MRITSLLVEPWTLPLVAPFRVAQRTADSANNVKLEIVCEDAIGIGVCAPVYYVTGESVDTVIKTVSSAAGSFRNHDALDLAGLLWAARSGCQGQPAALGCLEMAIYDLWAKQTKRDLLDYFGGTVTSVVTDMTIPIVSPAEASKSAATLSQKGFRTLKVKVGDPGGMDADMDRINAVVSAAPEARLRIDANQGYTPENAILFAKRLEASNVSVDFIEQPVLKTDHEGLRHVRRNSRYPIFADESVCSPADAQALIEMNAVDGIVVKLMKSGLSGAGQILQICRDAGIKTMIGCMLESGIGISAALAIGIGHDVDFFDLDSHQLLAPIKGLNVPFKCEEDRLVWQSGFHGWGTLEKD